MAKAGAQIKVTLRKSGIGYNKRQNQTLVGLGLKKLNSSKVLTDTPEVRGMVYKVSHLVKVEEIAAKEKAPKKAVPKKEVEAPAES